MKVRKAKSKMFQKKTLTKWEPFLEEIDHFLTDVGPGNVIEVVHVPAISDIGYQFIVWYWTDQPPNDDPVIVKV